MLQRPRATLMNRDREKGDRAYLMLALTREPRESKAAPIVRVHHAGNKLPLLRRVASLMLLLVVASSAQPLHAEDGYDLWLRYRPLAAERVQAYRGFATQLIAGAATPTQTVTRAEL